MKALYLAVALDRNGNVCLSVPVVTRGAASSALRRFLASTDGALALQVAVRVEIRDIDQSVRYLAIDIDSKCA